MVILPGGSALPSFPYLAALIAGLVGVGVRLVHTRPTVTPVHVPTLVPWMVLGSALHVLYVADALPPVVEPLVDTPAVYLSVAAVAGAMWLMLDTADLTSPRTLAAPGLPVAAGLVGSALFIGLAAGTLSVVQPDTAFAAALVITPLTRRVVMRLAPEAAAVGSLGLLALSGYTLDTLSTVVGVDVPSFGERAPLSRVILDAVAALPTTEIIGVGWPFIPMKLVVTGFVVAPLAGYVREGPTEESLLLGLVAVVGPDPGIHNLLSFAIVG